MDFTAPGSTQITLSPTSTTFTLSGINDFILEGVEDFDVTVNPAILNDYPGLVLPSLTVTIEDNDGTCFHVLVRV